MFVFDAKYRGNQYYDGIKDLCEVAFQKYTQELANGISVEEVFGFTDFSGKLFAGSFILHSSQNNKKYEPKIVCDRQGIEVEIGYNSEKYLGDYPDVWAKEWIREAKEKSWDVSTEKLEEWVRHQPRVGNNENKIGIITCNPKCNQLAYVLQMIMEQCFGLYQSKCWICGSDVLVKEKFTEKGYKKFHIKCQNPECGKFIVETHCGNSQCPSHASKIRIGKHSENYFARMKSADPFACWNVSCPICRQTAPQNSQYKVQADFSRASNYMPIPIGEETAPF